MRYKRRTPLRTPDPKHGIEGPEVLRVSDWEGGEGQYVGQGIHQHPGSPEKCSLGWTNTRFG